MPLYLALLALLLGVGTEVATAGRMWTLSYVDAVAVGVAVAGGVVAWRRRAVRLDLALLAYGGLLAVLVAQVLIRDDPAAVIGGSSRFVTAALLLFGLTQLARERDEGWDRLWSWPVAFAAFGSVLAVWATISLGRALGDPSLVDFYDVKRSVTTPLGGSNYLAAFLLVTFLIAVVHAVERDQRWLWPSAVILVGLLATMSRGALAAGVLVAVGLAVAWRGRHPLVRGAAAVGVAAMAFGLIVAVVASFTGPSDALLASPGLDDGRSPSAAPYEEPSRIDQLDGLLSDIAFGGRRQLYRASWDAFADHPVIGVGVNQLHTYTGRGGHPPHVNAHNLILHALATTGILGAVAYLAVWGLALWRLWAVPAGSARTALLAAVTALLLHAQVEALSHTRAVEVLLVTVLAIAGAAPHAVGVRDLGSGPRAASTQG